MFVAFCHCVDGLLLLLFLFLTGKRLTVNWDIFATSTWYQWLIAFNHYEIDGIALIIKGFFFWLRHVLEDLCNV